MVRKKINSSRFFFSKENAQTGGSTQNYWFPSLRRHWRTICNMCSWSKVIIWINRCRSWLLVVLSTGNKKVTPEKTSKDAMLCILVFFFLCYLSPLRVLTENRRCFLHGEAAVCVDFQKKEKVILSAVTQQCSSNPSRQRKRRDVSDMKVKSCCYIKACKHFRVETSNKNKA